MAEMSRTSWAPLPRTVSRHYATPRNPEIIAAENKSTSRKTVTRQLCGTQWPQAPAGLEEPLLQTWSVVSGQIAYNVGNLTRRLVLLQTPPVPGRRSASGRKFETPFAPRQHWNGRRFWPAMRSEERRVGKECRCGG